MAERQTGERALACLWAVSIGAAAGLRVWNALTGPLLHGYDGWAHMAYVLFIDLYHALPYADQGWSYFHPPLYYLLGFMLAQLGDAEILARGLALLGSAASLGVAGLAAWLVSVALPGPRWLACLAFTSVAFLPVHIFTGPMPGNEMLATLLSSAAVTLFLVREVRGVGSGGSLPGDLLVGLLVGLAMLTKYNALVAAAAITGALILRAAMLGGGPALRSGFARAFLILAAASVVAGPLYARNWVEFGTPIPTSHEHPKVKAEEARQAPGVRSLRDFVAPPGPAVFTDSAAQAPAVVRSVWGSVYLGTWFDIHRAGQFPRWQVPGVVDYPIHRTTLAMAGFGLLPSALALFGALGLLRSARRAGDPAAGAVATVDLGLGVLLLLSLGFFIAFAIRVPTFAAIKASYLLNLSVVFGWTTARGAAALSQRAGVRGSLAAIAVVALAACASCVVFASGVFFPERADHPDLYALRAHFAEVEPARSWLDEPGVAERRHAVEVVAAIELAAGRHARARELMAGIAGSDLTPEFVNSLAAATALSGRHRQALQIWNELLGARRFPEAMVSRGALRARMGDLEGGRADVERALGQIDELAAGWSTLAAIAEEQGRGTEAAAARRRSDELLALAPRAFPHGVGDGELESAARGERWMLWLDGEELVLYRPPRSRHEASP